MSNYFLAVKSKTVRSGSSFDFSDCNIEKLPQYLDQENTRFKKKSGKTIKYEDGHDVSKLYRKIQRRISQGYNIIVQGMGSKMRLVDRFAYRFLRNAKNVVVIRLHGLNPVSEQVFANRVFKLREQTTLNQELLIDYKDTLTESNQVYFIIHNLEEFYKSSKKVCEVIFDLIKLEPRYVHLVASSDHLNGGMLTSYLKIQLNLMFFYHTTWRSYFFERCHSYDQSHEANDNLKDMLMQNSLTLQSLLSTYHAVQENNKKIMSFILDYFVNYKNENPETKSTRGKKSKAPPKLLFKTLFKYTDSEFIVRHQPQLREYLKELIDHNVVVLEGQSNSETCLLLQVPIEIARAFLNEITL